MSELNAAMLEAIMGQFGLLATAATKLAEAQTLSNSIVVSQRKSEIRKMLRYAFQGKNTEKNFWDAIGLGKFDEAIPLLTEKLSPSTLIEMIAEVSELRLEKYSSTNLDIRLEEALRWIYYGD